MVIIVSDLPGSKYLEWKAHNGKIYDVQFGSTDEEKVYSLGEDKSFYLWATSTTNAPLMETHFDDYQLPPQLKWKERHLGLTMNISHPAAGRNKLFGFCYAHKYILISSVRGKVVYKVKYCDLCSNIFTICVWF